MKPAADTLARGWAMHQQGDLASAEQMYRQVLQKSPGNANAWCYLGIVCHDQGRLDEAASAYRKAIQLQPNFPRAYNNLGNTLGIQRRLKESLACFDHALALDPNYANALKNKSTTLVREGLVDAAISCYQSALQLDPADAESHKNLGVLRLLQGQFELGWPEYEWRWRIEGASLPKIDVPIWDGTPLDGRAILLTAEQGLGDTMNFIRYSAELKRRYECRVVAACQRPLLSLLRSCPGIDQLIGQDDAPPVCDVYAPLLSLPGILHDHPGTFPARIPYLFADQDLVHRWRARLATYGGVKIGLAWQGNRAHAADSMRSVPLHELLPLARLQGIHLISLQKGAGSEQVEQLQGRLEIVPLGESLDEGTGAFMETAAVMQNLDLVITSDMSIAHLAGALGTRVWVALAHVPDWRWQLSGVSTPWYPTMRLFRQSKPGDWPGVVAQITATIQQEFPGVRQRSPAEFRLASSGMNRLVSSRHGLLLYNRHDTYVGRSVEKYGEYSNGEVDLFRQLLRPGSVVVEAGANIGAHTLPISEFVGAQGLVYAFEPQRPVFQTLCANLSLNSRNNVQCRCEAVGEEPGWLFVPPLNYQAEANFGGLALCSDEAGEKIAVITIDSLQLPRCDLLKADVEGMELSVLRGAAATIARCRPVLYLENDRREKSSELIAHILSLGYNLYWHLPPYFNPDNFYGNATNDFPNLVSVNMLGIHSSRPSSISGLRRITSLQDDWSTP